MLNNVFKTAGVHNQQPWREYYKGIKPVNPLGKVVRRMGNKVKPVVSASMNRQMQFSYMADIVQFSMAPPYKPPNEPHIYNTIGYMPDSALGIPPEYSEMSETARRKRAQEIRRQEQHERELRRDSRRQVADTRANYRSGLDTIREARGWNNMLGVL